MNAIVASAAELARVELEGIEVQDHRGASTGAVQGDASQIEQLVANLVRNARDAVPAGGRIALRTRDLRLGAGDHPTLAPGDYVVLEVEDTGAGIDPAMHDHVFEPYVTTKDAGPSGRSATRC